MVDQPDGDGQSDDFNPYEPGEAAVDPAMPTDPTGGDSLQISPTEPPREPTVSRAFENLNIVLDRAFGPVGLAWLLLTFGIMTGFGVFGIFAAIAIPGLVSSGVGSEAAVGVMVLAVPVVIAIVLGVQSLFVGLTRSLRKVAFGGEHVISGVGAAFSTAYERFWSIIGMFVGTGLLMAVPLGVTFAAGAQMESVLVPAFGAVFVATIALFISPLFYIVPGTNLGLGESISKSIEVVTGNFVYLTLVGLAMLAAFFALACGMGILGIIPILGQIIGFVAQMALNFGAWIAFVTVFATIEETRGPFDTTMAQESPEPEFGVATGSPEPMGSMGDAGGMDETDGSDPLDDSNVEW